MPKQSGFIKSLVQLKSVVVTKATFSFPQMLETRAINTLKLQIKASVPLRNAALLQACINTISNIGRNHAAELFDALAIDRLDVENGFHNLWIKAEECLSALLDSRVF